MTITTIRQYQDITDHTAIFPEGCGTLYCTTKLIGEQGEFFEKIGKRVRDVTRSMEDAALVDPNSAAYELFRADVIKELGDICWYTVRIMSRLNPDGYNEMPLMVFGIPPDLTLPPIYVLMRDMFHCVASIQAVTFSQLQYGLVDAANLHDNSRAQASGACIRLLANISAIGDKFGLSLGDILDANVAKLASRQARGVLNGSGDNR